MVIPPTPYHGPPLLSCSLQVPQTLHKFLETVWSVSTMFLCSWSVFGCLKGLRCKWMAVFGWLNMI